MSPSMQSEKDTYPLATTAAVDHDPVPSLVSSSPSSSLSKEGATKDSESSSKTVPISTRLALSAISGMSAATVCHPLDVIRVQMQTSSTYRNSYHAGVTIYRSGGISALYAGISAAYLRQLLYGSCRMGIYSYLLEQAQMKNIQQGRAKSDISFGTKLGMGCISGAIGAFVGTPSEVALVRMAADSKLPLAERRNYTSVFNCLIRIVKEEGVLQLWRGAIPTVARATLLSSFQMGVTSESKAWLSKSGYFGPDGQWLGGFPMMLCATTLGSFCATVASNPFDVAKSRLQNMKVENGVVPPYKGLVDCFVKSVKAEGPMVVYAGFTPAFIKLAPYTIISLTLADKLTRALTGKDAL